MNADRLLALYDRVADAPDAITQLRRLVLDLAVRGRLVEQDSADEPASEALVKARCNLKARARASKRVRWTDTEPVTSGEIEGAVPPGWVPARLNDTGLYVNGLAFKPSDWKEAGTRIIRIQNLTDPSKTYNFAEGAFPDEVLVRNGDLLVSWSATLDAFRWDRGEGVLNQHIFRVLPALRVTAQDYLLLLLRAAIRQLSESDHAHGLVMKHINRGPFLNHVVLVPPLTEQNRIVAKVDELTALCDRLEETRTAREDTRDRLTKASYARLTDTCTDDPTFRSWARLGTDALHALTARAHQVKHLRHTILNLAVRGKLVQQNPRDEPASESLNRIAAQKKGLSKARKRGRTRKSTDPPASSEPNLELPSGWATTRLSEIVIELQTGPFGSSLHKSDYQIGGTPVINPASIRHGKIVPVEKMAVGNRTLERLSNFKLRAGDIVMGRRGEMGRCAVVHDREDGWLCGTGSLVLRLPDCVYSEYLAMLIGSPDVREYLQGSSVGSTMRNLNQSILLAMSIDLPPLVEQHRVVAKVFELMALCDRLTARLSAAEAARSRLLDSLIHESLASYETARTWDALGVTRAGA